MNKNVLAPTGRLDESKTFGRVEPLDSTFSHHVVSAGPKTIANCRSPQTGHARNARYAVWRTLDSLNGIRISAENPHYRGAFGHFACSATICSGRADGKTKPAAILLNQKHRRYAQGASVRGPVFRTEFQ
jgi:hypothetical protein